MNIAVKQLINQERRNAACNMLMPLFYCNNLSHKNMAV